jgi:hypothetical protein
MSKVLVMTGGPGGDLAFGKGKPDTFLDPRQGLVRIDL